MSYAYTNVTMRRFAGFVDFIGSFFFRERHFVIQRNAPVRILVAKFDQLGDCFLGTPIFEHIKKIFPQADIDVACQESSVSIFEGNPAISDIVPFNYRRMHRGQHPARFGTFLRFIRQIRRNKYDMTIDLRGEPFAALVGFLSGAKDRVGFEKEEVGGFLYTCRLHYDRSAHETKRYEKIIAALGGSVEEWQPRIYLTAAEEEKEKQLVAPWREHGYVVLHPGAGLPYKMWPREYFAEVVKKMLAKDKFDIILLGGKGEQEIGEWIVHAVADDRIKNMAGRLSLRESYSVISHAKAFLGNDSVLAHFAGALGVPTVVLMNAVVSAARWRPLGARVVVISGKGKDHTCAFDACKYPCPNMQAIAVQEVYEKWKSMLPA